MGTCQLHGDTAHRRRGEGFFFNSYFFGEEYQEERRSPSFSLQKLTKCGWRKRRRGGLERGEKKKPHVDPVFFSLTMAAIVPFVALCCSMRTDKNYSQSFGFCDSDASGEHWADFFLFVAMEHIS